MEILTTLSENKDLGVAILVVIAMWFLVRTFLEHIKNENALSRLTHKEISDNSTGALKEVTAAISNLHNNNQKAHSTIESRNDKILETIKETKKKIDDIHYQVIKK